DEPGRAHHSKERSRHPYYDLHHAIPFCRSPRRATEGCPCLPSGRAVSTAVLISFAEHDFARHNILNERLTGIFTKSPDQVATPIAGSPICAPCILICVQLHSLMQECAAGKFHFEPPSPFTSFDHLVGEREHAEIIRLRVRGHLIRTCRCHWPPSPGS